MPRPPGRAPEDLWLRPLAPLLFASLAALKPAPPSGLADHLEEIHRPAVGFQVRLPRLVVVRLLRVAAGPAASLPPRHRRPLPSFQPQPADVSLGDFAPLRR